MPTRRIILISGACVLTAFLGAQALSQARSSTGTARASSAERQRKVTNAEKQREAAKKHKEQEREFTQKMKEAAKEGRGPLVDRKKKQKEAQEKAAERRREFLQEKAALEVTEEQWKLIKPRLERLRQLREQADSRVGLGLARGPSGNQASPRTGPRQSVPTWQWNLPWEDKAPSELTEAQKLAKQLIGLVETKDVAPGTLSRTMDALRKARRNEAEIEKQLAEARNELCEVLTTRQEAALVLMDRF
jgi:hypothetical protein